MPHENNVIRKRKKKPTELQEGPTDRQRKIKTEKCRDHAIKQMRGKCAKRLRAIT